ncbi:MAG: hypothetical protein WDA28_13025 [Castellaniella sp.]
MSVISTPAEKLTARDMVAASQPTAYQLELFDVLWELTADITSETMWKTYENQPETDDEFDTRRCTADIAKIVNQLGRQFCCGVVSNKSPPGEPEPASDNDSAESADSSIENLYRQSFERADIIAAKIAGEAHFPREQYAALIAPMCLRLIIELEFNVDEGPGHLRSLILTDRNQWIGAASSLAACECDLSPTQSAHDFAPLEMELRPAVYDDVASEVSYINRVGYW